MTHSFELSSPPASDPATESDAEGGGSGAGMRRWLIAGVALLLAVVAVWLTADKVMGVGATQIDGAVEASDSRVLNFPLTARLVSVSVTPGQQVHAGQVLATVDAAAAKAALSAAEATLAADNAMLAQLSTPEAAAAQRLSSQVEAAATAASVADRQLSTLTAASAAQEKTAAARVTQAEANLTLAKQLLADCLACPCNPTNNAGPAAAPTPTPTATGTACAQWRQNSSDAEARLAQAQDDEQRMLSADQVALARANGSIDAAQAALAVAKAEQSAGTQPGTAADLAGAKAKVEADTAAIATAVADLTSRSLLAPVDAVVGLVGGTVGEVATPQGVRFTGEQSAVTDQQGGVQILPQSPAVAQPQSNETYRPLIVLYGQQRQIAVQVPEDQLSQASVGRAGSVRLPAIAGRRIRVRVASVDPTPVRQGGKVYYLVHLDVVAGQNVLGLMPGMSANATL